MTAFTLKSRDHFYRALYYYLYCSTAALRMAGGDFYVRYYVGHKGKFGHEFLEFEFRPDGKRGRGALLLEGTCLVSLRGPWKSVVSV